MEKVDKKLFMLHLADFYCILMLILVCFSVWGKITREFNVKSHCCNDIIKQSISKSLMFNSDSDV